MYALRSEHYFSGEMTRGLVIELLGENGRQEVGHLDTGQVTVGREPDDGGIAITNTAISRNHGTFVRYRNHWLYKDLGSTNGSWINGTKVEGGEWKLVRKGDLIQLADAALQLRGAGEASGQPGLTDFPNLRGRSLLVFHRGEFFDEFPIPEHGRALVIGGSGADLELEGDLFELPSLVIVR